MKDTGRILSNGKEKDVLTKGTVENCTFLVCELSLSDMDTFGGQLLVLDGIKLKSDIAIHFCGAS